MGTSELADFGAGIYRGRKAPAGSVYDAVEALVDDEGQLFERGKTTNYSASNGVATFRTLWVVYAPAVQTSRVLAATSLRTYVLNGALTPVEIDSSSTQVPFARFASIGDYVVTVTVGGTLAYYAGSVKPSYTVGTVTFTNGSATVTGAGTSWLANVDAGMVLMHSTDIVGVVKSVDSNTQITLRSPWGGSTQTGVVYALTAWATKTPGLIFDSVPFIAAAGSGSPRLLMASGNRVYFTPPGDPLTFDANSYHELPANAVTVGAEGMGDAALIFTTRGVWRISNLSMDPVDDAGNVQHIVEQVNKDVVLWDDLGVAAWDQGLVVPAIDDVYLMSADGEVRPVSASIRPLYRSYVKAGYQPRPSAVHRGHYMLPVLNGNTVVDALVCRLDRPYETPGGRVFFPWTRWSGEAASAAYATLASESSRAPKLLGLSGQRVTNLAGCFDTTAVATQDASGGTPTFTVETNDFDLTPGMRPSTATWARAMYETTGGTPTVAMSSAVGPEGSSYSAATLITGGGASDGTAASAWRVNRKAERIRLKFVCASQVTSLILRRIALTVRETGRP